MALRQIVLNGDPVLRKKARLVTDFNERLWTLLDDMHETLTAANGAGLAAPQVGILKRAILVIGKEGEEGFTEVINPVIIQKSGSQTDAEGCLSNPGIFGTVERPLNITVKGQDRHGKIVTFEAEGFQARAFCHEIDHLDGVLFTDRVIEYITEDKD